MEIGAQIKKYREAQGLSQEALAEKIFVTRQTISNWETGKSYPDVHSLMLLGGVFNVSIDQLVKEDIDIMKKEINHAKVREFNRLGRVFSILFVFSLLAFIPLFVFLKTTGLIIWAVLNLIPLGFGFVWRSSRKPTICTPTRKSSPSARAKPSTTYRPSARSASARIRPF